MSASLAFAPDGPVLVKLESFCRSKTLLPWADGAALGAVLALGWRQDSLLELMWKGLWAGSLLLVLLRMLGVVVLRVSVLLGRLLPSLSDKLQARNKRSSSLTVVDSVTALVTPQADQTVLVVKRCPYPGARRGNEGRSVRRA